MRSTMRCRTWWFRMVSPTLLWWKLDILALSKTMKDVRHSMRASSTHQMLDILGVSKTMKDVRHSMRATCTH